VAEGSIIGFLRVVLGADLSAYDKGMKSAQDRLNTFGSGIKAATKEVVNFRNAVAVVAGGALVHFIKTQIEAGDQIAKTSARLGISGEKYQELSYAAKLAGVEQDAFNAAFEQFNKRLGDFSGNVTDAQKGLGQLGIKFSDIKGLSPDEQFKRVAEGLKAIEDPARRAAIESDLFGKSGIKLDGVLREGADGLNKYGLEARNLGFILSGETLKKAEEASDEFDRIGKAFKVAGINLAVGFLPVLEDLRRTVTSQDFQDGTRNLAKNFGDFVRILVDNKDALIVAATSLAGFRVGSALGAAFGKSGAIIGGVTGAVGGFAAGIELAKTETSKLEGELEKLQKNATVLREMLAVPTNSEANAGLREDLEKTEAKIVQVTARLAELNKTQETPTKIRVTPAATPFDPAVAQAIEDLGFKTRVLKGDFDGLAAGFPLAAQGLRQFGLSADENRISVEQLSPQLALLNQAQLAFNGAQLTQEMLSPYEIYAQKLERINQLLAAGAISQETYSRGVQKAADNAGISWGKQAESLAGSFSEIAGSFGKENAKMAKAAQILGAVQALISTFVAQAEALKLPFPLNLVAVAAVAAKGFALVAAIKSQSVPSMATGGSFTVPGGSSMTDNVQMPLNLASGERVTVDREDERRGSMGARIVPLVLKGRQISIDSVRELFETLNEGVRDGYRIVPQNA